MKSSFKSAFEKKTNPDGSVELSFHESKFAAGQIGSGAAGNALFFVLLIPSCVVTSPVLKLPSEGLGLLLWIAINIVIWVFGWKWLTKAKGQITVVPNEGLRFKGKQLPFADIKQLSVMTEQAPDKHGNVHSSAYVFATAHGQEVRITKNVPESLATTLVDEIRQAASGALR